MFNSNDNGGDSRARQAVAVVVAVLVVAGTVTGVTMAAGDTQHLKPVVDDDFTSFDDSTWSLKGAGSYDSSNNRVTLTGGSNQGALKFDGEMPSSETWAVTYTVQASSASGGTGLEFYADGVETGGHSSDAYEVVADSGGGYVELRDYDAGSQTSVKKVSISVNPGDELTVRYDSGTVTVFKNSEEVLVTELENPETTHQSLGVRGWPGSGASWYVENMTVYDGYKDSDGDGETDDVDPYPYDAPETFTHSPNENETVDKAYLETANGSFSANLYGVNTTSGERVLLDDTKSSVGETTLVTLDAMSGYDEYEIEYHGNASVESQGLLYESNAGGGISSETFNDSVDSILGGFSDRRTGQKILGGLILVVGVILFIREGDC